MESLSSIAETIKDAHEGSPTPMRKVKSAVLSIRGASPMRPGPNVSPLKLALHRKQLEAPSREVLRKKSSQNVFAPYSPLPPMPMPTKLDVNTTIRPSAQGQVVKVTVSVETAARSSSSPPTPAVHTALPPPPRPARRNIFAPPTPQVTAAALASLDTSDETVGKPKYRPVSCVSAFTDRVEHDVPQDLRDLFVNADHILSATASPAHVDGLPRPMSGDNPPVSGRRRRNPPPAALPPSPPTPANRSLEREQIPRDSMQSEFDFDGEFANLDQGDQRASFVEALHRAQDYQCHDLPPLPPLPERGDFSFDQFEDASERASGSSTDTVQVVSARRNRKSPFAGTFAFQQHVSQAKTSNSPPLEDSVPEVEIQQDVDEQLSNDYQVYKDTAEAEDDTMELTVPRPTRRGHRAQRQDEAGISIATMSSIGDVIETGIAGDYTNYFDVEFARNNAQKVQDDVAQSSVFDFSRQDHSRQSSAAASRGHRRGHSRNTSIASLASINGLELPSSMGPPLSMHNRKRSSYISRHRSGTSFDFANGRSDWAAAHRRMQSDDSVMSNMSAGRICRPGLGARMFERDGGVQLTSITGSPADGYDQDQQDAEDEQNDEEAMHNMSKETYHTANESQEYSFSTARETPFDSEVDSAKESDWNDKRTSAGSGSSRDSIFGPGPVKGKGSFLLRPISAITTGSSSNEEDTFINVSKSITHMRRAPSCIEAQGEDTMSELSIID